MRSSLEPSDASPSGASSDWFEKNSEPAKASHLAWSIPRRENCSTPVRANSRYWSSEKSLRPTPTTAAPFGRRPSTCRL